MTTSFKKIAEIAKKKGGDPDTALLAACKEVQPEDYNRVYSSLSSLINTISEKTGKAKFDVIDMLASGKARVSIKTSEETVEGRPAKRIQSQITTDPVTYTKTYKLSDMLMGKKPKITPGEPAVEEGDKIIKIPIPKRMTSKLLQTKTTGKHACKFCHFTSDSRFETCPSCGKTQKGFLSKLLGR